jgi:hypothetical protein
MGPGKRSLQARSVLRAETRNLERQANSLSPVSIWRPADSALTPCQFVRKRGCFRELSETDALGGKPPVILCEVLQRRPGDDLHIYDHGIEHAEPVEEQGEHQFVIRVSGQILPWLASRWATPGAFQDQGQPRSQAFHSEHGIQLDIIFVIRAHATKIARGWLVCKVNVVQTYITALFVAHANRPLGPGLGST